MGNHTSRPSPSSSSSPSPPSSKPPTKRTKSWRSSLSSSSRSSTSTTSTSTSTTNSPRFFSSPSSSPPIEGSEFTLNTQGREYDVRPRPLRVGYPYYEDVLWEAELAARRRGVPGCGKKERRWKTERRGELGG